MIRLGIIIVLLVVFAIAFKYFHTKVIRPYQHQRRLVELDRTNKDLDEQLSRINKPTDIFKRRTK